MQTKKWLAALALTLPALGTQAQETLKIGGIGPLSGGGTAWGLAVQRGVQMAIDEVNAQGGLKIGGQTYKPELVMYDDKYSATGGRSAAERLVNLDKVKFIIGPIGTPSVMAVVPIVNEARVIMLSNGYAPDILKQGGQNGYNFRTMNSNVEFGPAMVKWLKENRPQARKVALIVPNDATGQVVMPTLGKAYQDAGYTVWSESYERGSKEFAPLLTRMLAQGVDVLDLNLNAPGEAGLLTKQARQVGFKGIIWQVGGPGIDEVADIAGPYAEGFMSYDVFDFNEPAARRFVDAYKQRWSGVINAQTPGWYNSARILFKAMETAGTTTDTDKVRAALENLGGFDAGIYGPVVWGGAKAYGVNHQLLNRFWVTEIRDGKPHALATLSPARE
ncbi:ABC transporter substrate-binding protein [Achromobacter deleyi]|uniref:ABC transporter substrate-binding protein n=1 Tax=Achromobacter deleyi TaxID=1353891 RepID=UPI0014666D0A|nr:ABC transporter substrate-binding protein [Achromobacter deleyi]CAB3838045.1 Leucine-, isoleucine-, valine-, threonine-, and alanine-binding protein [Achromobacter deleyi]